MDVINNVLQTVSHLNALGYFYLVLMLLPLIPAFWLFGQIVRVLRDSGGDYDLSGIFAIGAGACAIVCVLASGILVLIFFGGS